MKNDIPKLLSNVPQLVTIKNMDQRVFTGHMIMLGAALNTAKKIYRGQSDISSQNIARAAVVLGVDFGEVLRFERASVERK